MVKTIYEDTNPRLLSILLNEIHEGKAVLPDFQRNFVWEPTAIAELIGSMMQSYPAGSILRVRNTSDGFKSRHFEGAPTSPDKPVFLVLDGQQRLTSLYQAFYGAGSHAFFVDLKSLIENGDIDDAIISVKRSRRAFKRMAAFDNQASDLLLPLERLFGQNGDVAEWIQKIAAARSSGDMASFLETQTRLQKAEAEWLKPISSYEFPVVTLSDKTGAAAICTIFETLNRTGIKLTPFELLTARFFPQGRNLRDLWSDARSANSIIEDFSIDPYAVLQAITLRVHDATPTCKRAQLMELSNADIDQHWDSVIAGLVDALKILRQDCGVLSPRWLPYTSQLVPFSALLAKHPLGNSATAGASRAKLVRWFWCATLSQRYDNSANRKSEEDYRDISKWIAGTGAPPTYIDDSPFALDSLERTTPRQRALYAGLMCLSMRNDASTNKSPSRDFHTGAVITPDLLIENGIDDHHIFPFGYLNLTGDLANIILNRTLIDSTTNRIIGMRAPSDYLGDVKTALDSAGIPIDLLLSSHMLEAGPDAAIWKDDYEAFKDERKRAFKKAIESATSWKLKDENNQATGGTEAA